MATAQELKRGTVDQLRRVRLESKRLQSAALGYDLGEINVSDLVLTALQYAAEVRVYREMEAALTELGIKIPREVRVGAGFEDAITDVETTQPCPVRRGNTLQ